MTGSEGGVVPSLAACLRPTAITSEATIHADAIVVGAGPAGSTTVAILASCGWSVLLADRSAFPRDKTNGTDWRVHLAELIWGCHRSDW
jgi:choline dehydrogenase-like flavoprotein